MSEHSVPSIEDITEYLDQIEAGGAPVHGVNYCEVKTEWLKGAGNGAQLAGDTGGSESV